MTSPKDLQLNHEVLIPDFERDADIEALAPFRERISESFKTLFRDELPEEGHRIKRAGALLAGISTQAIDRGRAMAIVLPTTFDNVLEHGYENQWNGYQTAAAAAIAVGGLFGAWGYSVGKIFKKSLDSFPDTTKTVTKNHPVMVGVVGKAIDGFPSQSDLVENEPVMPDSGYKVEPYQSRKSFIGKVGLGASRGVKTAFLYGSTPHVGVAEVSGHSDKSVEKRLRVVSVESAVALGTLAAGVSGMITHDFLGIAEDVKDVITNKQLLMGTSLGLIGYTAAANYVSRKIFQRNAKENKSEIQES